MEFRFLASISKLMYIIIFTWNIAAKLHETENDASWMRLLSQALDCGLISLLYPMVLIHTSLFSRSTSFLACTTVSTLGLTRSMTYTIWVLGIFPRGGGGRCEWLIVLPLLCADFLKLLSSSTSWSLRGLPTPAQRKLYLYLHCCAYIYWTKCVI
jgi:hypothetical protein